MWDVVLSLSQNIGRVGKLSERMDSKRSFLSQIITSPWFVASITLCLAVCMLTKVDDILICFHSYFKWLGNS